LYVKHVTSLQWRFPVVMKMAITFQLRLTGCKFM
jgi:hypothetical protein